MLTENPPPSEDQPWAGDLVQLSPGSLTAEAPGTWYVVADIPAAGTLELYLEDRHPNYWDWAAAVDVRDVRSVRRLTPSGTRSWTLHPAAGGRPR